MQMQRIRYTEEQKEAIRNNLERILIFYGAKPNKSNWDCVPHRHNNPKENLSVNNNVCCCHCGLKGDSFNVISEMEGYDIKREFPEIIKKGLEILGNKIIVNSSINKNKKINNKKKNNIEKIEYCLTDIILNNFQKSKGYTYFLKRNIKDYNLFNKYKIFTGNPKKIFPENLLPKLYNLWSYQNIIPVWEEKKVVNVLLRRDDFLSTRNKKILNLKGIPLKIWNAGYLRHSKKEDCLFLTEGIFDALSFEQIGCKAIALNTVTMVNNLLKIIEENVDQLKENQTKFFIAFDNDDSEKAKMNIKLFRDKLDLELRKLGFKTFILSLNNFKDINDWHKEDPVLFKHKINYIVNLYG
jgi:hypothetical protein